MSLNIYTKDLYGRHGDRMLPLVFTFKDGAGAKIDITNYKFFIEIQFKGTTVTTYFLKGTTPADKQGIEIDLTSVYETTKYNAIKWSFGNSITLEPKQYTYAVKFVTGDNYPSTIIEGKFIIEKELVTTV